MKLSVLVPAYNEQDIINKNLFEMRSELSKLKIPFEIILIDDGSKDNTLKEARKASKKLKEVKVVSYSKNKGKGHAIVYGFKAVKGDLVTFLDADLELHPRQLKLFLDYLKKFNADVVVGSKRHPESKIKYPFQRKFLSNCFYFLTRILFGIPVKDTQAGIKLYKYKVLKDVLPKIVVKGYAFDLEILVNAHRKGYKIIEAPIDLNFLRISNRVRFRDIKNIFIDTLGILYRLYIKRYYD